MAVDGTPGAAEGSGPVDPQPTGMTYATWQASHFTGAELGDASISGPDGDANGDGFVNLLAYAFNLDPKGEAVLPEVTVNSDDLTISFVQHTDAKDLIYRVELSANLQTWNESGEMDANPTPGEGNTQRVTIKAAPQENASSNYIRVAVELKP